MSPDMKTIIKLLSVMCILFLLACILAEGCSRMAQ